MLPRIVIFGAQERGTIRVLGAFDVWREDLHQCMERPACFRPYTNGMKRGANGENLAS